jgi:hypothetical protein
MYFPSAPLYPIPLPIPHTPTPPATPHPPRTPSPHRHCSVVFLILRKWHSWMFWICILDCLIDFVNIWSNLINIGGSSGTGGDHSPAAPRQRLQYQLRSGEKGYNTVKTHTVKARLGNYIMLTSTWISKVKSLLRLKTSFLKNVCLICVFSFLLSFWVSL